eukprot:gene18059-24482_t
MVEIPRRELYIGGQWVAPVNGQRLDIINPATEAVVGSIPAASAEDVNKAVEVATAAAKSGTWTKSTGAYRAGFLRKIAQKVRDRKEERQSGTWMTLPPALITMLTWPKSWIPGRMLSLMLEQPTSRSRFAARH